MEAPGRPQAGPKDLRGFSSAGSRDRTATSPGDSLICLPMAKEPDTRKKRRPNAAEKRALRAAEVGVFVKRYGRKAPKRGEPNDRRHESETEKKIKRMRPDVLDRLLREDED
jgi:hypothetical protein